MATNTVTSVKSVPYTANLVARNMFCNFEMSSTCFSTASTFSRLVFTSNSRDRSHSHYRLFNTLSVSSSMSLITPKELNITIHRSSLITPLKETDRKTLFLSNMDLILNLPHVGSILFFSNHFDFPIETIVETIEIAFRKILVTYDYVAGRLKKDREGRPEIDCNSVGAGFVVASSDLSLEELGNFASSNPDYQKLAVTQFEGSHVNDQPLLNIQITSFKCGAFSLGVSFNHMIFDGIGYKIFLENLASLARNHPLFLAPINNRHLLSARSPPQTTFSHPELFKFNNPLKGYKPILSSCLLSTNNVQTKTFHVSATDILILKDNAKMNDEGNDKIYLKATDINVILAHIWRCIGLTINTVNEPHNLFSIIFPYNFRHRLRPRLPASYAGNALYFFPSKATFNELEVGPFSRLVQMIAQAETHLTDEYIRSAIDCIELHSGSLFTDALVSSWWKLGFLDTMYPWGKPMWNFPVLDNEDNSVIFILPDIEGATSNHGCNIVVSLQSIEMEKFQGFFDRFLGRM